VHAVSPWPICDVGRWRWLLAVCARHLQLCAGSNCLLGLPLGLCGPFARHVDLHALWRW
jgi:hypothetical protein